VPITGTNTTHASGNPQNGVLVLSDNLVSAASGAAGQAASSAAAGVPIRTAAIPFTLHEDGLVTSHVATQATVADALLDAGVTLTREDVVLPAATALVTPGMHVYVSYARRITVRTGDDKADLFTQAQTVGDALRGTGYDLQPEDIVTPARTKPVTNGMVIGLATIRDVKQSRDTPIPYATVYQYDSSQADGTTLVTQPGADGYVHHEYTVKQINGREVARQETTETTVQPTDEIVTIGTYVPATPTPEPEPEPAAVYVAPDSSGQCVATYTVWASYYTAASAGGSTTATGTGVYKGIIAVDPRVIPLGTRMYVPGYGYGIAADTGGGVLGNFIDLAYGPDDYYDWYSHYVDICILG
jgi:uncharacterized protein YabE (DUF348 family)/3D (Asp-Asp-Asp) domain-containing protein